MNRKFLTYSLSRLSMIFSVLMVFPALVGIIYREPLSYILNFLVPAAVTFIVGLILYRRVDFKRVFNTKDALSLVAICWILYSVIGAIPMYLYPWDFKSFFDALFESVAGFSTTGATIARKVEQLPHSIIFWRSFSQFIGGLGIIAFTVAILPKQSKKTSIIMKAESPGPTFGKITPKVSDQSKVLIQIYLTMTAATIFLLYLGDLDFFDSVIYGLGAAGTGGFANKDASVGYYNSIYTELILSLAMFLFSINFNIYYFIVFKRAKNFYQSEELKWYMGILVISIVLIFINTYKIYEDDLRQLVSVIFAVTSTSSTTGYIGMDTNRWPVFSRLILGGLMYVGGMAGSTAGGVKTSRVVILIKSIVNQVREVTDQNRVTTVDFEGKNVDIKVEKQVLSYIIIHFLIFLVLLAIISLDQDDFYEAFTAVATTFNGLGSFGDAQNFHDWTRLSKSVLSVAMMLGRLEIYPILLLFVPSTYKSN